MAGVGLAEAEAELAGMVIVCVLLQSLLPTRIANEKYLPSG